MSRHESVPRWGNKGRGNKAASILATVNTFIPEGNANQTWIDIGCGSGGIAAFLAKHVGRVIGIDPEPWPDWVELEKANPNLLLRQAPCDTQTLPAAPEIADVVVCNQVYEHVHDPAQLLRNVYGLLKPSGVCYFAGPNLLWPIEPHVFWPIVHWLPRRTGQRIMSLLGSDLASSLDAYSTHYWKLTRWMRQCGFTVHGALHERLLQSPMVKRSSLVNAVIRHTPPPLISILHPLSPGFVFILRKCP